MAKPVDIHIHLADEDYGSLFPYLETYLKTAEITLVSVAMDLKTSEKNIRLAQRFPRRVIPFVGVHPQMAGRADLARFQEYLIRVKDEAVGVGEIGLDRRLGSNQDVGEAQKKAFRMQLEAAERFGKPVSIHSRGTLKEILEALPSYRLKRVLLHWFAGGEDDLRVAVERGYYASFGPALVYSKSKRRLAASIPSERLLTETDGPVRFGACFGGRMALPVFLPSVLFALASVLKMRYEDALELVQRNSERYLGTDL